MIRNHCLQEFELTEVTSDRLETVGERLHRLRLERGLSQRDLAAPGVSYAYISRIEAGARRPSVKALRKLAPKLGVSAEYLETGSEIGAVEARELRLAQIELRLRLDGTVEAEDLYEILDDAVADADTTAVARANIALGQAAAARGDHAETIRRLELAIGTGFVTAANRPDVWVTLGHALALTGQTARAGEIFDHGLEQLNLLAHDDPALRVRFSSYLSHALADLGELQRAREIAADALSSSTAGLADPYSRVRLHWSLGRMSLENARPHAALESLRRAVALLEATEDTIYLARAHLNSAHALIDAHDLDEAFRRIEQAEALLGPAPAPSDLAAVRRLQALCASGAGRFDDAERLGNEALALAERPKERGHIWWAIATARVGAGSPEAGAAFQHAVELLAEHGTVREHADLLRTYGRYLRDAGLEHEALGVFEQAADVASDLQGPSGHADG
jgi:transcriptional regulator with XRE-family HTH domain